MGRAKASILHPRQKLVKEEISLRPVHVRIKRAILAGKRGPSTPVPSWKLYENPFYEGLLAAVQPLASARASRHITMSARKLAATLWELQEVPLCRESSRSGTDSRRKNVDDSAGSPRLLLPPPSPKSALHKKNSRSASVVQSSKSNITTSSARNGNAYALQPFMSPETVEATRNSFESNARNSFEGGRSSFSSDATSKEVEDQWHPSAMVKLTDGAVQSGDMLNALNEIKSLEDQNVSTSSLAAVLRLELEHTRARVRELEHVNKSACMEIEVLQQSFANEREIWRVKEQERIRTAVQTARQEAENERRIRRKIEMVNKRLAKELEELNSALLVSKQELEKERKARALMEDVCDELAREIGEDKAEVEELKRQSAKVRQEVEEERKMLQMAEIWREERVQMKLAEARHELEEKNVALDKLRMQLEEFLKERKSAKHDGKKVHLIRNALARRSTSQAGPSSSEDDDLHSIDLNKGGFFGAKAETSHHVEEETKERLQNQESMDLSKMSTNAGKRNKLSARLKKLERPRRSSTKSGSMNQEGANEGGYVSDAEARKSEASVATYESRLTDEEDFDFSSHVGGKSQEGSFWVVEKTPSDRTKHSVTRQKIDSKIAAGPRGSSSVAMASSSSRIPRDQGYAHGPARQEARNSDIQEITEISASPLHQHAVPTRLAFTPQRNSWSSGDFGNSHVERRRRCYLGDNSLRSKLLEAKLELQYSRSKCSK